MIVLFHSRDSADLRNPEKYPVFCIVSTHKGEIIQCPVKSTTPDMVLQKKDSSSSSEDKKEFESLSGEPDFNVSSDGAGEGAIGAVPSAGTNFFLVPVPLVMKDANSVYLHVNQASPIFLGFPGNRCLVKDPSIIFLPSSRNAISKRIRKSYETAFPRPIWNAVLRTATERWYG